MWPYNCLQFSKSCTKFSYESPINYAWNSVDRYICDSGKDDEMRNIQEVRLPIYIVIMKFYSFIFECLPRIASSALINHYQWYSLTPTKEPYGISSDSNFHHQRSHREIELGQILSSTPLFTPCNAGIDQLKRIKKDVWLKTWCWGD